MKPDKEGYLKDFPILSYEDLNEDDHNLSVHNDELPVKCLGPSIASVQEAIFWLHVQQMKLISVTNYQQEAVCRDS